jgi:CubicO group peptidase (beta-lactamase class C family)
MPARPPARRRFIAAAAGAWGWSRGTRAQPAPRLERLEAFLQQATLPGGYLGAVALVVHAGRALPTLAVGYRDLARTQPMTADTIFRLYSMSKPIATVAVLMLMEDGRFTLDDPVSRWLPALSALRAGAEGRAPRRALTIHHLLTHTAGFAGSNDLDAATSLADYVDRLARLPLATDPGERFAYDGMNTEVACRLVEVVSGQPFDRFVQQRILQPLAMIDTGFAVPAAQRERIAEMSAMDDSGHLVRARGPSMDRPGDPLRPWPSGAGGLYSTAADYARFARLLLEGGTLDGQHLLDRKTVALMFSNQLGALTPPTIPGSPGEGFGLGGSEVVDPAQRGRPGSVGQFGWTGASSTAFFIDPSRRLLGVLLAQHLQRDASRDLPRLNARFQTLVHQSVASLIETGTP